jgi:hypothetical protein
VTRFDIRVGWTKRKRLLTRAQLERLNGGPLPLMTVKVWKPRSIGPTVSVLDWPDPPPTLFLPVSERERRRWAIEDRLREQRERLFMLGITQRLKLTDRERAFLETWTKPRLEVP